MLMIPDICMLYPLDGYDVQEATEGSKMRFTTRSAMALAISLTMIVGCGQESGTVDDTAGASSTEQSSSTTSTNDGSADGVVLDFPTWQADAAGAGDWWRELIAEFEVQNPGVTVNLQAIPFNTYVETITTRFAAGDPPDVVQLPTRNFPQFAEQGWLAPLDDRLSGTDILQSWTPLQSEVSWNGETQGLLLLAYGYVMYYNEALLANAGVDVPTSPQELIEGAAKVTNGDVFGFGATTVQHPNNYTDVGFFVTGDGLQWHDGDEFRADDPQVVAALQNYRDAVANAPIGIESKQALELFSQGKIAMFISGPFLLSQIEELAPPEVMEHVRVALPPFSVVPGGVSNSIHIASASDDQSQDLVWELIELAASEEWQQRYAELVKAPPPRDGAVSDSLIEEEPAFEVFMEAGASAESVFPQDPALRSQFATLESLVSEAAIELITTDHPTADVAAALQEKLEEEFAE